MATSAGIELLNAVTCPNCWEKFPPESALAVAGHGDLMGDPLLEDPSEYRRFLPTRFTPECAALDERDTPSFELACPHCHLVVPRVLFERYATLFMSIFGRTTSGKSYFLAAMSRQLETALPQRFGISVTEPHPLSNQVIRDYRNALFSSPNPDVFVRIPATDPTGTKHYQTVRDGTEVRNYPRPMFFQVSPSGGHPNAGKRVRFTRTICLYDNAGEHFRPQWAKPNRPETQHLARSSAMLFVFDPTREPAFIERCRGVSADPQFEESVTENQIESQDVILATADQNVKKWLGREIGDPLDKPLIVILAKFDAWKHLVSEELVAGKLPPFATGTDKDFSLLQGFRIDEVERISGRMRNLLLTLCPTIVTTAERFSRRVCYVPVSATGCAPVSIDGEFKHRRGSIQPLWAEVPLLWALQQLTPGIVPVASKKDAHREGE